MRVKILQGKQTGQVVEVCQSEGENMLTTGFAELAASPIAAIAPVDAPELPEPEVDPVPEPLPAASRSTAPKPKKQPSPKKPSTSRRKGR